MKLFTLFLVLVAGLLAADSELSNRRSGISLTWGVGDGSDKGTAYMEEYLFSDKTVSDRKVVYIKDTTAITATHNAYNNVAFHNYGTNTPKGYFRVIGADGLDGIPDSGDEGIIRYRVDREGATYYRGWTAYGTGTVWPAYSVPLTFATMTYEGSSDPVVGTTGVVTGDGYTGGTQRGIVDDTGDEWHVISVGDDDRAFETEAAGVKSELQASDGKTYVFVVNPKTPGITVRATGDAQFYTTPPKVYLVTHIFQQTTYMTPGTGTVTIEMRDLYGRNIEYRVTAGSTGSGVWTTVGASTYTLTQSDFVDGTNTFEYRSVGYEANAKTRTVVKNPTHPSLAEPHGHFMWGDSTELAKITARLTRTPYSSAWSYVQSVNDNTFLNEWDAHGTSGDRNPIYQSGYLFRVPLPAPQANSAFVGLVLGFDTVPASRSLTWGQYAKQQLMHGMLTRIDPVDFERNQSNGANPSVEILGAGYYQVGHAFSSVIAYDILAGHYRSDQNAAGLTPCEDYFIRDILATTVSQMNFGIVNQNGGPQIGLWGCARTVGAILTAQCMSEYSTPYYGTSGYGTVQTDYPWTPHQTWTPTWKEIYDTTPAISATIPGTTAGAWNPEETALWRTGGIWGGPNLGYFNLLKNSLQILLNTNARHGASASYPTILQGLQNSIAGTLVTIAGGAGSYAAMPLLANSYFGATGDAAADAMKARAEESTVLRDYRLLGLLWYDDTMGTGADVIAPTILSAVIPPSGDTIKFTFSETVTIGAGGSGGFALTLSGGASTATYSFGDGTNSLTYTLSRTTGTETGTYTFTPPTNGIEDTAGNDLASKTATTITVQSTSTDTTAPTVSITTPSGNVSSASSSYAVAGPAADNVAVLNVVITNSLGGEWIATGTTSWTATVTLQAGDNIISAVATDTSGNVSTAATRTITYTPPVGSTQTHTNPRNRLGF